MLWKDATGSLLLSLVLWVSSVLCQSINYLPEGKYSPGFVLKESAAF